MNGNCCLIILLLTSGILIRGTWDDISSSGSHQRAGQGSFLSSPRPVRAPGGYPGEPVSCEAPQSLRLSSVAGSHGRAALLVLPWPINCLQPSSSRAPVILAWSSVESQGTAEGSWDANHQGWSPGFASTSPGPGWSDENWVELSVGKCPSM